jgi:TRAP-type mannitol/chloroaromatic compound transport system permease small subunit
MTIQKILHGVDSFSTWIGKAFAWLIVALMLLVCVEVFKRYIINMPTGWVFDVSNMFYGTLFMMCGAYTLAQDGHVRGDFLYGSMKPRKQASLDLVLYILFFMPGILALTWAGWVYAGDALAIRETTFNATPLPVYPFKYIIPLAGAVVLVQGLSEILRAAVCIKTGEWPPRLKDAEESDVVEQQLANSEYVDEESRRIAIESAKNMEQAAAQARLGAKHD